MLTGLLDATAQTGRFKDLDGNTYTGQIKDTAAHGKGVMELANGTEYSGDWDMGVPSGYGKDAYPASTSYYSGGWSHGAPIGFGEGVDSRTGKYLGQRMGAKGKHGPFRHISIDGAVHDTIWEDGKNTEAPCDASEAAERAHQGIIDILP